MKKMTIKQYADHCGISPQAAHKRLAKGNIEKYPEIKGIERVNKNFFFIIVSSLRGCRKNATVLQK